MMAARQTFTMIYFFPKKLPNIEFVFGKSKTNGSLTTGVVFHGVRVSIFFLFLFLIATQLKKKKNRTLSTLNREDGET